MTQKILYTIVSLFAIILSFHLGGSLQKKDTFFYRNKYIYYRDKYISECELYLKIIQLCEDGDMEDESKIRIIKGTYVIGSRMRDIDDAIKLKKSLERNKDEK